MTLLIGAIVALTTASPEASVWVWSPPSFVGDRGSPFGQISTNDAVTGKPSPFPYFIPPELATLTDKAPANDDWACERLYYGATGGLRMSP